MTRTSRAIILAGAGALALAIATPGLASAADSAPTFSRGGASTDVDSELYAGYTSELGSNQSISGTLTLPKLGSCATDGGLLVAIELSDESGGDYVDGGSYSSCVGGTKSHSIIIESTAEGQVVVGEGDDGDKIKVVQKVLANGDVKVSVTNVTQGTPTATETISGATIQVATAMHWGQMFVGGEPVPTLDYNKLAISGVEVGGKPLKASSPTKYDFAPSGNTVLKTSKITKKKNFSTANVA